MYQSGASPSHSSNSSSMTQRQMSPMSSSSSNKPAPVSILRSPPPIEVDYDINPTRLYKLIESKDWQGTVDRTRSNPEEAQTWVMRKESDGKLRWKLLPLHAALILKSPGDVVAALIKVYHNGAQCKDDQGEIAKTCYDFLLNLVTNQIHYPCLT